MHRWARAGHYRVRELRREQLRVECHPVLGLRMRSSQIGEPRSLWSAPFVHDVPFPIPRSEVNPIAGSTGRGQCCTERIV